jgi:hypothetical protein
MGCVVAAGRGCGSCGLNAWRLSRKSDASEPRLAIGVSDGLLCRTLKDVAAAARPNDSASGVRTVELEKSVYIRTARRARAAVGFTAGQKAWRKARQVIPFSHAANGFALATALCVFYRRRGWIGVRSSVSGSV